MLKELGIELYRGLKGTEILIFMEYLKEGLDDSPDFMRFLSKKWKKSLNEVKEIIKKRKKVIAEQINQH